MRLLKVGRIYQIGIGDKCFDRHRMLHRFGLEGVEAFDHGFRRTTSGYSSTHTRVLDS